MKYILIYAFGIGLLVLLAGSYYKNIQILLDRVRKKDLTTSEIFINYPLTFLWLLFMTVFALGLMINNTP
jgi:hypothetical protein